MHLLITKVCLDNSNHLHLAGLALNLSKRRVVSLGLPLEERSAARHSLPSEVSNNPSRLPRCSVVPRKVPARLDKVLKWEREEPLARAPWVSVSSNRPRLHSAVPLRRLRLVVFRVQPPQRHKEPVPSAKRARVCLVRLTSLPVKMAVYLARLLQALELASEVPQVGSLVALLKVWAPPPRSDSSHKAPALACNSLRERSASNLSSRKL